MVLMVPFLFAIIVYWMLGFHHEVAKLLSFVLTLVLIGMTGNSLGVMTGCLFKDVKKSTALAPVFLLPLILFSGIYSNDSSIASWFPAKYISPFRYGLIALLQNQVMG